MSFFWLKALASTGHHKSMRGWIRLKSHVRKTFGGAIPHSSSDITNKPQSAQLLRLKINIMEMVKHSGSLDDIITAVRHTRTRRHTRTHQSSLDHNTKIFPCVRNPSIRYENMRRSAILGAQPGLHNANDHHASQSYSLYSCL